MVIVLVDGIELMVVSGAMGLSSGTTIIWEFALEPELLTPLDEIPYTIFRVPLPAVDADCDVPP